MAQHGLTIGARLIKWVADGALYTRYVVAMPTGQTACHRKQDFEGPYM